MPNIVPKFEDRLAPVVKSTANPQAELLLVIRALIPREQEVYDLFLQFKAEAKSVEWLRDMLAPRLVPKLDEKFSFQAIVEACQYLADEFNQLGEGYFIVSTTTGKVNTVLTEEDLYDPGLQARHSGEMVQGLKQILPEKAVAMTVYEHEKDRERGILETLAARAHQTDLLREEGDPRLLLATRAGRSTISKTLSEDDPYELMRRSGGTTGMFLRHFKLTSEPPTDPTLVHLKGTASFRSTMAIQDALTLNLSYNRLGNLRAAAAQGWVRDICRTLAEEAFRRTSTLPIDLEDLTPAELEGVDLWVANPSTHKALQGVDRKVRAVPIDGVETIGLTGQMGYLHVDNKFAVESHERFNRWEVVASLPYDLYLTSWDIIRTLHILGVPLDAVVEN